MSKGAKTALAVGAIVVGLFVVFSVIPGVLWRHDYAKFGMMGWPAFGGFGLVFIMPFVWLALIGLVIWAIVAAVSHPRAARDPGGAMEILNQRYARGEIGKEEYEAKKKDITQ